jgi:Rrf2 family protein
MRLPVRATYAVRLMVALDRLGGGERPVQLAEVALATGVSRRYLEQLAIPLKNQALIRAVAGRKGGYLLNRPPAEITLRAVLEAVMGPIELAACVSKRECMRAEFCECRLIWALLNTWLNKLLERYSIADLSDPELLKDVRKQLEALAAGGSPELDPGPRAEDGAAGRPDQ